MRGRDAKRRNGRSVLNHVQPTDGQECPSYLPLQPLPHQYKQFFQRRLVLAEAPHADIPFSGKAVVGGSFGDSTRLLEAVKYIFEKAGSRPCVVNISLGTNGGPHDGSTLVEDGLDRLISQTNNRAVTIAASNSYDDGIHAAGTVGQSQALDLIWQVAQGDSSHNEFELWYDSADRFDLEIIASDGTSAVKVRSRIDELMFTTKTTARILENIRHDPDVQSVQESEPIRFIEPQ